MPKQKFTKRADGRYMCSVYLGKDENGKRQYKPLYGRTQKELQKKYNELMSQIDRGIDVLAKDEPFGKWVKKYLNKKKNNVSEHHYRCLKGQIKHFSSLNDVPITKIRPIHIQEILDELANRDVNPLAKKTLTDLKNIAYGVFEMAINNRIMDFNPVRVVEVPKGSGKTVREAISDEQIEWIKETKHNAQTAAMIMLYAGLRRGELLALTWSDIDLDRKTIKINKSVEFINNQAHLKPTTKTQAGMRLIAIPDILVDYLKTVKKMSPIVCTINGKMFTEGSWRRMWESYMSVLNEKYGNFDADILAHKKDGKIKSRIAPGGLPIKINTFTPHQLRHTYASMLYKSGIDVLTAKEQLGHSDVSTTLNVYTHLDSAFKSRNMDKLNAYISDKKEAIS